VVRPLGRGLKRAAAQSAVGDASPAAGALVHEPESKERPKKRCC
jgi:hypothetical protein